MLSTVAQQHCQLGQARCEAKGAFAYVLYDIIRLLNFQGNQDLMELLLTARKAFFLLPEGK